MGAVAISPLDSAGQPLAAATPRSNLVVYAGTGQFSNGLTSGAAIGLLRSTDGGDTWTLVDPDHLVGLPITAVVPTTFVRDTWSWWPRSTALAAAAPAGSSAAWTTA
jgi:hypothetical protein